MPRETQTEPTRSSSAPATFNTINKIANSIADNYALTSIAECIGSGTPTLVVPFVNTALAARAPFRRSIDSLKTEGVHLHWARKPDGSHTTQELEPRSGGLGSRPSTRCCT